MGKWLNFEYRVGIWFEYDQFGSNLNAFWNTLLWGLGGLFTLRLQNQKRTLAPEHGYFLFITHSPLFAAFDVPMRALLFGPTLKKQTRGT